MLSIFFAVLCATLILLSYRISHNMINVFSVIAAPYMLVVPINNFLMIHRGFYQISNKVIYMLGGGLLCIFAGYIFASVFFPIRKNWTADHKQLLEDKFSRYRINGMLRYTYLVEALALLRFFYFIFNHGIAYIGTEDFAGKMLRGPFGHLLLTIYPIIPILFLYWLRNKSKIQYLVVTVLCVGLLFTTFVKYHVIGMIVLLYLFVSLEDRRYMLKGLILVSSLSAGLFILNYALSFLLRGTTAYYSQEYYFNHLWSYMSGSLIYDNHIFQEGVYLQLDMFYKIGMSIFPLVNLFLDKFLKIQICPGVVLNSVSTGPTGQAGNIVDSLGFFYPSRGNYIDLIGYAALLAMIGAVFTIIFNRSLNHRSTQFHTGTGIFLTFFCFFSFYGTFYHLVTPWEILVWSFICKIVFDKRIHLILGRRIA